MNKQSKDIIWISGIDNGAYTVIVEITFDDKVMISLIDNRLSYIFFSRTYASRLSLPEYKDIALAAITEYESIS